MTLKEFLIGICFAGIPLIVIAYKILQSVKAHEMLKRDRLSVLCELYHELKWTKMLIREDWQQNRCQEATDLLKSIESRLEQLSNTAKRDK